MNLFHGYTGRRLEDRDGYVTYAFIHEGGAVLVLRMERESASGLENKRVVVKGRWTAPTTILAEEVQIDISSPKVSALSRWRKKMSGIIAQAILWWPH